MPLISVYTATYNRAYTLGKGYEALLRQNFKDFEWVIVDDGSTDNTKELVSSWINEGKITIRYFYQPNRGVNSARNKAIENIESELCIMVDSDDYLTDDALEKIADLWQKHRNEGYVGIIGMDKFPNGEIIGKRIPDDINESTLSNLYDSLKISGDKKMVYLTSLCKKYPTPVIEGERYYPNKEKYYRIDKEGQCLILHDAICVAEYLPDGITASRYKRYVKNPIGLSKYRLFLMEYDNGLKNIIRQTIHYDAMKMINPRAIKFKDSPHPFLAILLSPFGFIWGHYILVKGRK